MACHCNIEAQKSWARVPTPVNMLSGNTNTEVKVAISRVNEINSESNLVAYGATA